MTTSPTPVHPVPRNWQGFDLCKRRLGQLHPWWVGADLDSDYAEGLITREQRRVLRRQLSNDVARAALKAGLISNDQAHVLGQACTDTVHDGSHARAEPVVFGHFLQGTAGGVDAVKKGAGRGLVVHSQGKSKSFAHRIKCLVIHAFPLVVTKYFK